MEEQQDRQAVETEQLYQGTVASVLQKQKVDPAQGLSAEEVSKRIELFGPNKLAEEKKTPLWHRILAQFKDVMVIILIVAAVISGFLGDWVEAIIILAIVVVNAVLGVVQEGRAEQAVGALQKMSSPTARVIRGGKQQVVTSEEIVPGDIILIEAGDIVPADCRLIEGSNLKADESALTGESVPVEKDANFTSAEQLGIGDRENMLFSSTAVTYGRGTAIAVSTGSKTEMGKIAGRLTGMKQELTPLQINLNQLGTYLAIFCVAVVVITFIVGVMRNGDVLDMFMTAVSLAVAAIPEGLSAVVTIVLALGMNRMAERNSIVKRLLAVETLGSVNIICSDKTGTLTQNEMTVTRLYAGDNMFTVSGGGYEPNGEITSPEGAPVQDNPILQRLMEIATLCNEAELQHKEDGSWQMIGDPTEGAMLSVAGKFGAIRSELDKQHPRLGDLPFDSDRKMMTVFHDGFPEGKVALTKGAPDIVLDRCSHEMTADGVVPLTAERKTEILASNSAFARTALRVLSFAYSIHEDGNFENVETNMIFAGLMGMIDPARPEARDAIAVCTGAGIRAVMITGDYKETAVAIAKDLGLMKDGDNVMTGAELEKMSDSDLRIACEKTAVYARVSPEHKVRIVEALQSHGHIASMTGDGVNDAPALKRANIGVAMGITGTEVAKSAADMILTDDNFATIVHAVEEGRVIYSNIRKFVGFLLSCNVGEILVIFITMLVMGPDLTPLLPIQLLWLNLITDSFPALALGREKAEPDIMLQKPRKSTDKILNPEMIMSIIIQAVAIFAAVFIAFNIGLDRYGLWLKGENAAAVDRATFTYVEGSRNIIEAQLLDGQAVAVSGGEVFMESNGYRDQSGEVINFGPSDGAMTYAFVTLICAELLRAFSNRSEHYSVFKQGFFSNSTMNKSILLALGLTMVVVYVPFLNPIFDTIPLALRDWAVIMAMAVIPFVMGELFKFVYHRNTRRARIEMDRKRIEQ